MAFENLVKIARNFTDTTVKKTGEQVQITKLALEKSGLEKEMEALYTKIGRHCYALHQNGETLDEAIDATCAEVASLEERIADIANRIDAHKVERDGARYRVRFDDEPEGDEGVEIEVTDENVVNEIVDEAIDAVEDAAEDVEDAVSGAAEKAADTADDLAEAVKEEVADAAEEAADAAGEILGE